MSPKLILGVGRQNVEQSYSHLIPVGLVNSLRSQLLEDKYIYMGQTDIRMITFLS